MLNKFISVVLIIFLMLSYLMMPSMAVAQNHQLPALDGVRYNYYQVTFPTGLRYSPNWIGTFSYVPTEAISVMYDDTWSKDWGICLLAVPKGKKPPSGAQGGTTIVSLTLSAADTLLKKYTTDKLVKPFDDEIVKVMKDDHYFIGAWAGDKLKQRWDNYGLQKNVPVYDKKSDKYVFVTKEKVIDEFTKEEKEVEVLTPLTEKQVGYITTTASLQVSAVDLEKFDPDRYFVMGQVFFTDGTANCDLDGRIVADSAFTVGGAGNFTINMANGTTGTITGTNVTGSPVALAAGLNTITTSGAVADGNFDITIGTAANWNSVNSWSAATGGACGASVPTNADNTYFNANSFTAASQVVTVDATATCLLMDFTGATNSPTFTGGNNYGLSIYGSCTFIAAMTVGSWGTYGGGIYFCGDATLTTNGATVGIPIRLNGSGKTLTLADNLIITYDLEVLLGAFTTADKTITQTGGQSGFSMTGSGVKAVNFGSSSVSCSGWSYSGSNCTLTAGTSTISVSGTGAFAGGGLTYYTVRLNGTAHTISGNNTYTYLFRTSTNTKTDTLTITAGSVQTTARFAMQGYSATSRLLVQSSVLGTAFTITAANWNTSQYVDVMDCAATNAIDLSAITGLSGDCGGNTGITFTTTATQTSTKASTWDDATMWTSRVPLPQDDVTCSHNVTVDMPRIGKSITFTGTPTVTLGNIAENYGSLTLSAGATYTYGSYNNYFRGRGSFTITSSGKPFRSVFFYAPSGTYTIQDDFIPTGAIYIDKGTVDFNDKNISALSLKYISYSTPRTIYLGNGVITLSDSSATTKLDLSNATLYPENSTIILTNSTANAQTFAGGGLTYNNVTVQGIGAYVLTVTGNNIFNNFTVNANQSAKAITATGTTQTVNDFTRNSGTNAVTITNGTWTRHGRLANGGGTFTGSPVYFDAVSETIECTVTGTAIVTLPHGVTGTATSGVGGAVVTDSPKALVAGVNTITVTAGGTNLFTIDTTSVDSTPIALDYLNVTGSTAQPANVWYAGSHSGDGGGNTQWLFTDPALTTTSQAATAVTMDKDGVTGGTFNGTVTTSLDGTPFIGTLFNYGLTGAYGASTASVTMYDNGTFTGTIPATLTPGETYHFRGVSTNGNAGSPFNGGDQTFTFTMPIVTETNATISGNNLQLNGSVTNMGVASTTYVYFEWGITPSYGNTTPAQTLAGIGAYSVTISTPSSYTVLYYRAVAQNGVTLSYGSGSLVAVPSATGGLLLRTILRILVACAILIGVVRLGSAGVNMLITSIIGITAFFIIDAILTSLF